MNEKKYIFCIPASDDFAVAAAVLIYSIKRKVKIAGECDFVVPYNNLSQEAMKFIEKAHSDVKFEKPKDSSFYSHIKGGLYGPGNHDCYLSFESFWQDGYKRSIYLDADMLCIKDFSDIILENNKGFGWKSPNNALMVISDPYLGEKTYRELIDIAVSYNTNNSMGDQDSARMLFEGNNPRDITYYDQTYNFQHWGGGAKGSNEMFLALEDEIKIIHYSGRRKPWGAPWDAGITRATNMNCIMYPNMVINSQACKLWYMYYEEFKMNSGLNNGPIEQYENKTGEIVIDTPAEYNQKFGVDTNLIKQN